jgi:hypothetical protein
MDERVEIEVVEALVRALVPSDHMARDHTAHKGNTWSRGARDVTQMTRCAAHHATSPGAGSHEVHAISGSSA